MSGRSCRCPKSQPSGFASRLAENFPGSDTIKIGTRKTPGRNCSRAFPIFGIDVPNGNDLSRKWRFYYDIA